MEGGVLNRSEGEKFGVYHSDRVYIIEFCVCGESMSVLVFLSVSVPLSFGPCLLSLCVCVCARAYVVYLSVIG